MGKLDALQPAKVFYYFEQISQIPRGTYHVGAISDYVAAFARERGLEYVQDAAKNVIIKKPATEGYEKCPAVILQGHMDMVLAKEPDAEINLLTDPLQLEVEGDYISAKGTTLGGDDGIAVAYALALLDSDDIPHPALEVMLTVNEEGGMDGARDIDLSVIRGKKLINIDSEEEGVFTVGCAGGGRVDVLFKAPFAERRGNLLSVTVTGLLGGHSGEEIHKARGNANCIMGRLINVLGDYGVCLKEMEGGNADNAIPREATAHLLVPADNTQKVLDTIYKLEAELQKELYVRDPDVEILITQKMDQEEKVLSPEDTLKFAQLILAMPNGVQAMSSDVEGLVQTSLNMGLVRTQDEIISLGFSVRSSVASEKEALIQKVRAVASLAGCESSLRGLYPGWAYRKESPLRDEMIRVYKKIYNKEPEVVVIHAGLECGLLLDKKPDLDAVSIGPNMKDIHTPNEKLSISSSERVWKYLLEVLKEMKNQY